ncbi:TMEM165/GDT1 family protein [Mycolicibacterium novocastrense]|uniref:GDT1 family protein n=1 Tax=Mycolicibacterium novocastrense TaxID=59813 RepID=A0AAW5STX5_MYCNV|nr:TMEM165/GDT1 family protein [Mycolicibacterium novocastrense]MCV7027032.1 TMEM165/GDT1 family protein [Mycolicibacterium novocastrense]GAT08737.1 transmembrane protein [Mycolicibacterium novocastrense]
MLPAILVSLAVVFVAELGDKSQLITMTYSLRYRWWVVLSGVGIAAMLVHGLSVAIGHFLGMTLPERPIAFVAAIAFLLFAVWTWRENGGDDEIRIAEPRFVVPAIVSSFVLAELGDKTMLATVALASEHNWTGVWIGATAGMILADGAAIAAGRLMHRRLPERFLHGLASVLFLLFGLWLLFDGALGLRWVAVAVTACVTVSVLVVWLIRRRRAAAPDGTDQPSTQVS